MSPELIFKFHQEFKQLQIHAGMGVTEQNIAKIEEITYNLANMADDLYYQVYPMEAEPELPLEKIEAIKEEIPEIIANAKPTKEIIGKKPTSGDSNE